jgi:hypothetical protein
MSNNMENLHIFASNIKATAVELGVAPGTAKVIPIVGKSLVDPAVTRELILSHEIPAIHTGNEVKLWFDPDTSIFYKSTNWKESPAAWEVQTNWTALFDETFGESTGVSGGSAGASAAPVTRSSSVAYEAGRQVVVGAATLKGITGHNSGPAQFIQLHDVAAAPADGEIPVDMFFVPADTSFAYEPDGLAGDAYADGIYICNSSTGPTKTIGASDCWFTVRYKE